MVKLNRITTKTGDGGQTGLGDGSRCSKSHLRISVLGEIEEANAALGLALAFSPETPIAPILSHIQNQLFDLGSDLCVPIQPEKDSAKRLHIAYVSWLETQAETLSQDLTPLTSFILPGGTILAAHLHLARTLIRRAERSLVALSEYETINPVTIIYLNRLSDLMFQMSRSANRRGQDDILWQPAQGFATGD